MSRSVASATLTIPAPLVQAYGEEHNPDEFQRWAVESLVLMAVGDGLITTGYAAELLGIGYFPTLALLKERGVHQKVTDADFEADQADLRKISVQIDR